LETGSNPVTHPSGSVAAVSSWLAIAVLLRFVSRYSFGVFAAYRLVLGVVILMTLAARG
jgi:undecaprenyl-diphosphatase